MNRSRWCCVGVVALVFVAGLGALAKPCTITVQPGESIQAAIDAAPEGAVVCLAEGGWDEHLVIGTSLTLRGAEGGSTIWGYEEDLPVIRVHAAAEVLLEKLTVTGGSGTSGHGILVEGSSRATIHMTVIVDNDEAGVSLRDSAQVAIRECSISMNGFGIYAWHSTRLAVSATTVSENTTDGVVLGNTSQGTVTESDVSRNGRFGIWLWSFSQVDISGCTVVGNAQPGIWVGWMEGDAPHASIRDSTFSENDLWITASASATVAGCTIVGRTDGIMLRGSPQATIEDNWIALANRYGVVLWEGPCVSTDELFAGYVSGSGNTIPGPDEEHGNRKSALCPDILAFLMTDKGGELDRRE